MKMLKYLSCCITFGLSNMAQADFIGIKGSVDYWLYHGHVQAQPLTTPLSNQQGSGSLIINPDLDSNHTHDLKRDAALQFSFAIEHPIPLFPNAKIRYVNLDSQIKNAGHDNVSLHDTDFILYYQILDNIVNLDLGIGATHLSGDVSRSDTDQINLNKTYPIIYLNTEAKLPFTGLMALAEVNYSHMNNTKIRDIRGEAKYELINNIIVDVGAKVGYRMLKIDLDDHQNNDLNFEFKGPYIGLEAHF
ncbi:outer membrane protein [Acinetobacter baylyi]|uniref:Outer membrane protein n=1 Tax=Acinetobacter baylyi TaxID=202950 RepID=A0ABU0UX75_ACIBI|nr:TIGR04219 family outer membrane beta-barrel protein [Acinetobacter baylyi]MDQ1209166.1 outer membrane protein [Acinetobacter baylyi]MDR6107241.1 outer membrane protein [Acinetobacter baylyi]MDR6186035.1 outer membrane protein [Acinetobacter baylyi]